MRITVKIQKFPGNYNEPYRAMEAEQGPRGADLKCSCVIQHMSDVGEVLRAQTCKGAVLDLGRNEVEDIVVKVSHTDGVQGPYTIREHTIYKRFMKDGKATIVLKPQKIQFLISNCPPDHLKGFLQSLAIKCAARGKIQGSHRRMLGDISLKFNEISPLSAGDVETARKNKAESSGGTKLAGGKENKMTPSRRTGRKFVPQKRKLSDMSSSPCKSLRPTAKKPAIPSASLSISPEQARVLEMVKSGESVFFTGSAGTGKSHLLKRIIQSLPPDTTFPTASTGAAACLVGGTTLHAFAGMGNGGGTLDKCISLASRDPYAATWRRCQCLIIDEISMVDAEFFDKMEGVARAVRKSKAAFGGIQLVVCGDFLQLPPVSKGNESKQFCFEVSDVAKLLG
jgi:ATP-dependent DNA helicase PIF1